MARPSQIARMAVGAAFLALAVCGVAFAFTLETTIQTPLGEVEDSPAWMMRTLLLSGCGLSGLVGAGLLLSGWSEWRSGRPTRKDYDRGRRRSTG